MTSYISLHISANGTGETDKGHERIPETINTVGHDGNHIVTVLACLFYFKVQSWNLSYNSCMAHLVTSLVAIDMNQLEHCKCIIRRIEVEHCVLGFDPES